MRSCRSVDSHASSQNSGRCRALRLDFMRRGAVAVETALLMPFLATLILGITEIGQVQRAQCYVSEAAYAGGSTASRPGSSSSETISDIRTILTSCKMTATSAVITIKVNDVIGDVATAQRNDKISVTVAIPVSAISWSGSHCFVSQSSVVSKTVVMLKQG